MDVATTCNMFVMIAEARGRAGDDLQDVAAQLAVALNAVMMDGIGNGVDALTADERFNEFQRLLNL